MGTRVQTPIWSGPGKTLYIVAVLLGVGYAVCEPLMTLSPFIKLIWLLPVCIALYIGGRLICVGEAHTRRVMLPTCAAIFGLYCVLLLDVVLFDSVWFDREPEAVRTINLIPFRIIVAFVSSMLDSRGLFLQAVWNVGGNLVLFCPFALFLPLCAKWTGKWYGVLGISAACIVAVELAQYISARGNGDIDDVILNLSGVMLLWGILQIPPVKRLYASLVLCMPGQEYFQKLSEEDV